MGCGVVGFIEFVCRNFLFWLVFSDWKRWSDQIELARFNFSPLGASFRGTQSLPAAYCLSNHWLPHKSDFEHHPTIIERSKTLTGARAKKVENRETLRYDRLIYAYQSFFIGIKTNLNFEDNTYRGLVFKIRISWSSRRPECEATWSRGWDLVWGNCTVLSLRTWLIENEFRN